MAGELVLDDAYASFILDDNNTNNQTSLKIIQKINKIFTNMYLQVYNYFNVNK
jgi:hypothetical protein